MFHKLNRLYNRIYAFLNSYYWAPCPLCGKMYGGHEAAEMGLMRSWHSGISVCHNCSVEANRLNKEWMSRHKVPIMFL